MSNLIWQGLMISVMGMGLTLAALVILILTMMLLERFSRNSVEPPISSKTMPDKKLAAISIPAQDTEEEIAAAIAMALVYLRSANALHRADVHPDNLGATLEAGRGPWWIAGRTQQRSANISKTTPWRN